MPVFTDSERVTLTLIAQTFAPALSDEPHGLTVGAVDLAVPVALEEALKRVLDAQMLRQVRLWLRLIEQPVFNRLTVGSGKAFSVMLPDEREALLRAWAQSRYEVARRAFQGLKRLTLFLFYSMMPDGQPNPTWQVITYRSPEWANDLSSVRPITPLTFSAEAELSTDVLIIGSGAGGSVVAGELSAAGHDVIVVEKGDYYHDADFHGRELESTEHLFEHYGSLATTDYGLHILAGSVLGGGTTINWGASIRTPDTVLDEWARVYGFTGALSPAFKAGMEAVCARLNVNVETPANAQNRVMCAGLERLGYHVEVIPRNVKGCVDCGFCNFGCPYGAKQSAVKTYLQDAHGRGGRIIVRAMAERILIERGTAVGAVLRVSDGAGRTHSVTVHARVVVVAAGALHTPALLLRSGLENDNIGAHLHLHPTTVIYGLFDQSIRGWEGPSLGRISNQFVDLDGRGWGVRLEIAPVHPGIAALTLPWESGRQHKRLMGSLAHLANIIILTRDYGEGRVTVSRRGALRIHYRLHPYDARHMMHGLIEALRVHHAAGAREVSSPHARHLYYRAGEDSSPNFEAYLAAVRAEGLRPNSFALFSAHQMSSCRIGRDTSIGALDPTGETYEVRNLYVADASAMPSATGVNPMISIMATAHYIAQHIKARL